MEKLNIWLIQIGEILPLDEKQRKMRTAFLVDKLVEKGHNVLWWTSAFDHFKKDWIFKKDTEVTLNSGLRLYALKGIGYKKNISLSRFIDHRIIAWKFKKIAPKMPKPDIIIASTPPYDLAYQAVKYAKRNKIPMIVDIRDEWPDIFLNFFPSKLQKIAKLFLFNDFRMIKKTMMEADALISMMNSLLNWGLKYANRKKRETDRVFYIGAKKVLNIKNVLNSELQSKLQNKFVISYISAFSNIYNPEILIDCAKKLKNNKNIIFVLAGDGPLYKYIKEKASNLANVVMLGWLNQNEISSILQYSKIGIVPTPFLIEAFPNKVFTYLSSGLPIISSLQGELKSIIEKYQIGFYYPPNDVEAFVNCILKLYNNPQLYKKMSENAKRIFDEMFDADKIYEEYANHIEKFYVSYKK
jgi:glycosyltransferase involved in cell wall biosynthesis